MNSPNIRKIEQFDAFIDKLEQGTAAHWSDIAAALGIGNDTIIEWRKHPRAQEAIRKGIEYALSQMEQSGRKDWRMWSDKLRMLGVGKEEKKEIPLIQNNQFNFFSTNQEKQNKFNKKFESLINEAYTE